MTASDAGHAEMQTSYSPDGQGEQSARQAAMAVFARASISELETGLKSADCSLACQDIRPPETGLVMARGRISGTGKPFNLGEVTVTRAVVQLPDGKRGFAYLRGRSLGRARLAAIADAHWQSLDARPSIEEHLIQPVRQRLAAEKKKRNAEVAATQVDFFTMVRGDD